MSNKVFIHSRVEMEEILKEEDLGYLGLAVKDEPYVIPVNYVYEPGRVIFHCALEGKKLEYIRSNPRACFTVGRQNGKVVRHPQGAQCHIENDSVVCYGQARIVEPIEERLQLLNIFNHHLQPDAPVILAAEGAMCFAVEIKIEQMTGRRQREKGYTHWSFSF
jgi:nitroimidazol reductase NimA-like FMN-containing flavoprotein (pyridoxamine 5'-phosphate oxidase superfamily)